MANLSARELLVGVRLQVDRIAAAGPRHPVVLRLARLREQTAHHGDRRAAVRDDERVLGQGQQRRERFRRARLGLRERFAA